MAVYVIKRYLLVSPQLASVCAVGAESAESTEQVLEGLQEQIALLQAAEVEKEAEVTALRTQLRALERDSCDEATKLRLDLQAAEEAAAELQERLCVAEGAAEEIAGRLTATEDARDELQEALERAQEQAQAFYESAGLAVDEVGFKVEYVKCVIVILFLGCINSLHVTHTCMYTSMQVPTFEAS